MLILMKRYARCNISIFALLGAQMQPVVSRLLFSHNFSGQSNRFMMRLSNKELLLCLVSLTAALAALDKKYHVMQKSIPRHDFVKREAANADVVHELVFAVKQNNLVELDKILIERSTPGNPLYQEWLNYDQVGEITSNVPAANAVLSWLAQNDVSVTWQSAHSDYIKASAKISKWEGLLNTKFFVFEDLSRNTEGMKAYRTMHRATEYSLPVEMKTHLSAVFNTVQVPPVFHRKYYKASDADKANFKTEVAVKKLRGAPTSDVAIDGTVTVAFLNQFYQISSNAGNVAHQQSVFETSNQSFSQADLAQFQTTYTLPAQECMAPYGYDIPSDECTFDSCGEGNLDVQYIMGVAQQTATIYWYVTSDSTTDPFVAWVTDMADMENPPYVSSMSWGIVEQAESQDVLDAFNTEAMKLASMGVTITVSSGDNGAAEDAEYCNLPSGSGYYNDYWTGTPWSGRGYFPDFPATSPYVTAVGATQGPESGNPEISCQSQLGGVITSGGGFSTYYPTPSWQTSAVNKYFASLTTGSIPTLGFNKNGRGYPDVSLIGVQYQVVIAGTVESVFGTSASAPVFAAMISLVNAERATQNKTSVGFINPTLYAYGSPNSYFNDITSGNNKCMASHTASTAVCCNSGFTSIAGWDPLTGFGSVNFPNLVAMFSAADAGGGDDNDDGLSDGAVAGIVVGSVAGAALIGAAAFFAMSGAGASAAGGSAAAGGAAAGAGGATGTAVANPVAAGAANATLP